jgi:hypothetical protein
MPGRRGILVAVLTLCGCSLLDKDAAPEPSESVDESKQPASTKQEPKVTKAEAEAAMADAKAAVAEAKAAVEEAKAAEVEPLYPPLDPKRLEAIKAALAAAPPDPEDRVQFAARAIEDLEQRRLPKSVLDALRAISSVPPEHFNEVICKAICGEGGRLKLVRSPGERAWLDVCEDGDKVLNALANLRPEDKIPELWKACKLDDNGLLDQKEAVAARSFMLPVFAITIHGYIKARTEVHPVERQALRTLAMGK